MNSRANDNLRRTFTGGRVVMTTAVAALPDELQAQLLMEVRTFEDFNLNNDPYGEHDLGIVEFKGERWMWKIDDYGSELVLTIMHASEY